MFHLEGKKSTPPETNEGLQTGVCDQQNKLHCEYFQYIHCYYIHYYNPGMPCLYVLDSHVFRLYNS